MNCPVCNEKLIRKRMGIFEGCLSAIAIELAFWLIAGVFALFLYRLVTSTVIFVLAFIVLIGIGHYIDRKYTVFKCESCDTEYRISDVKKKKNW